MSDRPITRRTLNTLTSFRASLLSAIGHLRVLEEDTANPRARSPSTTPLTARERTTDSQVCEGCHSIGHHYTECLNHSYVWDSEANARLLAPGERLSAPADWQDIHRASLHHLIRTALQYYIKLHHTRIQDIHLLLSELEENSEFGDISEFRDATVIHESPPLEDQADPEAPVPVAPTPTAPFEDPVEPPRTSSRTHPGIFLINLAVLTAATRLRIDPWNGTTGYIQFVALNHWHPSFGIDFPAFLSLVHTELLEARLHGHTSDGNPYQINIGPPSDPFV
jgi:hypothetical protein